MLACFPSFGRYATVYRAQLLGESLISSAGDGALLALRFVDSLEVSSRLSVTGFCMSDLVSKVSLHVGRKL
jgi:hypothetical protein